MDSIDILYSLQKSLQKQIGKKKESKLVDCLRKKGKNLEKDYYSDEWYCGVCEVEFNEGGGLYFNTSGDGIEFCNKCLNNINCETKQLRDIFEESFPKISTCLSPATSQT